MDKERSIFEPAADTARKIKKALQKEFSDYPKSHFSVRSSTYTGGSSVRVGWKGLPKYKDVQKIADRYSSASFDGMTDMQTYKGYKDPEDGKRYMGADYIILQNEEKYIDRDVKELEDTEGKNRGNEDRKRTEVSHVDVKRNKNKGMFKGYDGLIIEILSAVDVLDYDELERKITRKEVLSEHDFGVIKDALTKVYNALKGTGTSSKVKNAYKVVVAEEKRQKGKEGEKKMSNIGTELENKIYTKKMVLAEDVLKVLLQGGPVRLDFTKADGSNRKMLATRNPENVENVQDKGVLYTANTKQEIAKSLERGTIAVYDLEKKGMRAFVVDRLISFSDEEGPGVKVVWEKKEEKENKHYDPTKLKTEKIIDILGKKVVRLVFKKKDGTKRPMVATRVTGLVDLYSNVTAGDMLKPNRLKEEKADAVQRQIERDYVTVFDLSAGEFRTFKPSTLVTYDEELDIASWIEFTVANDAWYDIARNGVSAKEYYQEGKKVAKNIGSILSERKRFEDTKIEYLIDLEAHRNMMAGRTERAKERKEQEELKIKRRNLVKGIVNNVAISYEKNDLLSEEDRSIYTDLVRVPDLLKNNVAFNNMENTITQIKNVDKYSVVAMQIGKDVIYMHPKFIVNAYSGRVFIDATKDKSFKEIGKVFDSDADWGAEDVLNVVAKKIQLAGKGGKNEIETDEMTQERMVRILTLAKNNQEAFRGYGMVLSGVKSPYGDGDILRVEYKGRVLLFHPNVVLEVKEGKGKVLFRVIRKSSRLTEYENFFKGLIRGYSNAEDKKIYTKLATLIAHGNDRRKRVKEVS